MKKSSLLALILCPFLLTSTQGKIVSGQNWLDLSTGWEFAAGKNADGSMENSGEEKILILNYNFESGGGSVTATYDFGGIEPIESLQLIQILAKGPAGSVVVGIEDAQGQLFLYRIGRLESDEQRMLEVNLQTPSEVAGKVADKNIHYPIKTMRVTVEKDEFLLKGTLTVERIALHGPQYQKPE